MKSIDASMKWIMLIAGLLTCTMIYAAIAPQAALRSTFGESLEGPVAEIVVRNWGALIALVGALLIYGAFHAAARALVLAIAGISKVIFIGLVLTLGQAFLGYQAGVAVIVDSLEVALFAAYLIAQRKVLRAAV